MAGYSGTPLAKKLGIAEGHSVLAENAPADYGRLIDPLPPAVTFAKKLSPKVSIVHLFVTELRSLEKRLGALRHSIEPSAVVWVSWPKKSSKVPTDITEDRIREAALPLGFVDVKVCAIDDVWSGLKLVIRRELREKGRS